MGAILGQDEKGVLLFRVKIVGAWHWSRAIERKLFSARYPTCGNESEAGAEKFSLLSSEHLQLNATGMGAGRAL